MYFHASRKAVGYDIIANKFLLRVCLHGIDVGNKYCYLAIGGLSYRYIPIIVLY